jgi:hypothetical protein
MQFCFVIFFKLASIKYNCDAWTLKFSTISNQIKMLSHSIFSTGQRPQDPERLRAVRGQLQRGQGQVRGAIREGQDR